MLAVKEWREILRDKLFFALAFVVPSVLMLVFGYGIILDVEKLPFAVLDQDRTEMSRDYLQKFTSSRYFDYQGDVTNERELSPLLADSKIRLAIIIPENFQKNLIAGHPAQVQTLIDGTFPFRAQTAKGYIIAINAATNAELLAKRIAQTQGVTLERARELVSPVRLELRYLYNQELNSRWSVAAALVMFILMVSPPFLTALGVVREKENGSIYNIYTSTVTRGEFLIGKLLPYIFISVINVVILWFMATVLFGAPFKGDPVFFMLASVVYVGCTTGIGLLVSLLVHTQVAAMIMTAIITVVPSVLYSGLLVPISSLEAVAQIEAHLFPAMYYTNIVLGSFIKGVGLEVLWGNVVMLIMYAAALWCFSFFLFKKRPKT
mgnify:FL=1